MLKNLMTLLCSQVWLIWLAVVSGLLIRKITLYQSFVRYIRAGMTPVADIAMLERLSEIGETGRRQKTSRALRQSLCLDADVHGISPSLYKCCKCQAAREGFLLYRIARTDAL